MQIFVDEIVLLLVSFTTTTVFALLAVVSILFTAANRKFRYWTLAHLLVLVAFIPADIVGLVSHEIGVLLGMLFRGTASMLFLKAFRWDSYFSRKKPKYVIGTLGLYIAVWISILLTGIPLVFSMTFVLSVMAFASLVVADCFLRKEDKKSKLEIISGLTFSIWAFVSSIYALYPFFDFLIVLGYVYSIVHSALVFILFFSYVDYTKRRYDEQLRLTQTLGSIVSHDLRNYVNTAYGAVELIVTEDEENHKWKEVAIDALKSASFFINDTRQIIKTVSSQDVEYEVIDLQKILNDIITRVQKEHNLERFQVRVDSCESILVLTNKMVRHVIWNIIDNAITHSEGHPDVEVKCQHSEYIVLTISDRSGGLDPVLMAYVNAGQGSPENLGLGLAIIYNLSRACNFTVFAEDRIERKEIVGTTFVLEFERPPGSETETVDITEVVK